MFKDYHNCYQRQQYQQYLIKSLLSFFIASAIFLFLPEMAFAQVIINEVEYDSIQSGTDSQYEWVELYNPSDLSIILDGWVISDNAGSDIVPTATISGHSFLVLTANEEGFKTNYPGFSGQLLVIGDGKIGNGLSNNGDFLELNGSRQVEWSSGTVSSGHSLERMPVGTGGFVEQENPTPGIGVNETPTPEPTEEPEPTEAPTPTPIPTSTPTPTKKPTPTLKPSPTSTPAGEILGEGESATNAFYPLATEEAESTSQSGSSFKTRWLPKIFLGIGFLLLFGASFWVWYTQLRTPKSNETD